MRKWVVIVGLVCAVVSNSCASSGRFTTITLSNALRMHEEHDLIAPEVRRFPTATTIPLFQSLVKAVEKRGHKIVAIVGMGNIWGFNDGEGTLYINAGLSVDEAFSTILHELGHSLQPPELNNTPQSQVYAEAFGYLVCYRLGLNTAESSFAYLQQFPFRHEILRRYAKQLDQQVDEMVKDIRGE
jgi:hypothetical protein